MASVASQLIEEVTAHVQRDSLEDAREICADGTYFLNNLRRRLSIPLGKLATGFQAEVYAILACTHEIEAQDGPEKYVSICSDSQVALKALQAAKTMSPLV